MPTARTKTKKPARRVVARKKAGGATASKRLRRKTKMSFSTAYDARKFAGTVPGFATVTAEEMRKWRDDD